VIPPAIAAAYAEAESHIEISEEVVLAVEALDGQSALPSCGAPLIRLADRLKVNEEMKKTIMLAGYLQDLGRKRAAHVRIVGAA